MLPLPINIILISGFWLDGDSWSSVPTPLRAAGHTVHPLTLPGKQSAAADRAGITWRDHVDDSGPLAAGSTINDELPIVDDEDPLPNWSVFEVADLTDELREYFRSIAGLEPPGATSDAHVLRRPRHGDLLRIAQFRDAGADRGRPPVRERTVEHKELRTGSSADRTLAAVDKAGEVDGRDSCRSALKRVP